MSRFLRDRACRAYLSFRVIAPISLLAVLLPTAAARADGKITGTVLDEETGKSIPSFVVIVSEQPQGGSFNYAKPAEGADGAYECLSHSHWTSCRVRIEADGYMPAISPPMDASSREVVFDAKLRAAPNITGVILSPDGKPISDVQVLLAHELTHVMIRNGRAGEENKSDPQTQTNDAGEFSFPPLESNYRVIAVDDAGYLEVTREQLEKSETLKLVPWGSIEGVAMIGSKPAANVQLFIHPEILPEPADGFQRLTNATTDDAGHFSVDRIAPGRYLVGRLVPQDQGEHMPGFAIEVAKFVDVRPNETAKASVGGSGRPLVGNVKFPTPMPENWVPMAAMLQPSVVNKLAKAERRERSRAFAIARDGKFRIEDVVAGEYDLRIFYVELNEDGRRSGKQVASGAAKVTVPEMPGGRSDEVLDIGAVELKPFDR